MDDEYVGDEILFQIFNKLKEKIKNNVFTNETKQELYEIIKDYNDGNQGIDQETLNCLFLGYIIKQQIRQESSL